MIIKVAEYRVKKESLSVVLPAVSKFVEAVRKNEPDTFYEAYHKSDSFEFVHLMKFKDDSAEKQHQTAEYTTQFVSVLYPQCEVEPHFTDLTLVE